MTVSDTMFVALPGKWASLSFNLSFDVAFLNNHRFTLSFLSLLFLMQTFILFLHIILKCFKELSHGLRVQKRFSLL